MDRLAIFLVFVTGLLLALPAGAGADASDLSDQNLVEIGRKVYQEGTHEFRCRSVRGEPVHVRAVGERAGERLCRMQLFR